jgi:hypothetical protein
MTSATPAAIMRRLAALFLVRSRILVFDVVTVVSLLRATTPRERPWMCSREDDGTTRLRWEGAIPALAGFPIALFAGVLPSPPGPWKESGSMKKAPTKSGSPSALMDARIEELGDWRGKLLARLRALIKQAVPDVVEEWKWRGTPVWSRDGIICTGETYKSVVKMTFAKGASLKDPAGLFNSSLDGNVRRAIDFHEGDEVDEKALKALIRAAVAANATKVAKRGRAVRRK